MMKKLLFLLVLVVFPGVFALSPVVSNNRSHYIVFDNADIDDGPWDYWVIAQNFSRFLTYNVSFNPPTLGKFIHVSQIPGGQANISLGRSINSNVSSVNYTLEFAYLRNTSKSSTASSHLNFANFGNIPICDINMHPDQNLQYYNDSAAGDYSNFSVNPPDNNWVNVSVYWNGTHCEYGWYNSSFSWSSGFVHQWTGSNGTFSQIWWYGDGVQNQWGGSVDNLGLFSGRFRPLDNVSEISNQNILSGETFTISFYINVSISNLSLYVNNTNYTNYSLSGNNVTFTVAAPFVNNVPYDNFDFNLTFNDSQGWVYLYGGSFFVYGNSSMRSCSSPSNESVVFVHYNEEAVTQKLATHGEVVFSTWVVDKLKAVNSTFSYDSINATFCTAMNNNTVSGDVYVKYNNSNGFTHRFYLFNVTLNNETKYYDLFNFNRQTGISDLKITTRNLNTYALLPNVLTKLLRYYPSENVWRTVQMDLTGQFGLAFFNIIEENVDYRLIFTNTNNDILSQTETSIFVCETAICDITYILNPEVTTSTTGDISIIYNYDNSTGNISIDWSEAQGLTSTVTFTVTKELGRTRITICDQTQVAASGSMSCDVSSYTGDVLVRVIGVPNDEFLVRYQTILNAGLGSVVSIADGSFFAFGIGMTAAAMGIFSPVGVIIASFAGLIIIFMFGLINTFNTTVLIITMAVGLIIAFKVKS